jgi:hypothetical protein
MASIQRFRESPVSLFPFGTFAWSARYRVVFLSLDLQEISNNLSGTVSRAQRQGTERVGTHCAIGIRKVRVPQLHERGGTVVCDGGGMFATEDQYLVVPGTGHEIIDRIRCLTLSRDLSGLSAPSFGRT